ncbi:hypothetical protein S7335_718 [Synechococcus sp. PCC 7335]|nr:hypothetical protein S7335_718 [Synechococcus sp. PCC 7335]
MPPTVKTLLSKLLFWCVLEIVLNYVGLDNLADYSEFIANQTINSWQNKLSNSSIVLDTLYSK